MGVVVPRGFESLAPSPSGRDGHLYPIVSPALCEPTLFWKRSQIGAACEEVSNVCFVKSVALAVYSILSTTQATPAAEPTLNLYSVLEEWGET